MMCLHYIYLELVKLYKHQPIKEERFIYYCIIQLQ